MNCQLCQKNMDAYQEGRLPAGMKTQVEAHLRACEKCAESYSLQKLAERIMIQEKEMQSNPFLATRILARIEDLESSGDKTIPLYKRVLRPVIISASLAAAILYGVMIGNIYQPSPKIDPIPLELALIDDSAIESVNVLSNE